MGRREYGYQPGEPEQSMARARMFDMGQRGVPVAERVIGEGRYLRPNFIQFYRCDKVLVEDVTLLRSPMWEIQPVLCENVTIRGVTVTSHGPNNDGCNPESCNGVLIENCSFDTGDGCITLKSGRNNNGRRVNRPIENVVVRNCRIKDGYGAIVIGSEISGGARNIFAEKSRYGLTLRGFRHSPLQDIHLKNCDFKRLDKGNQLDHIGEITFENVTMNGKPVNTVEAANAIGAN